MKKRHGIQTTLRTALLRPGEVQAPLGSLVKLACGWLFGNQIFKRLIREFWKFIDYLCSEMTSNVFKAIRFVPLFSHASSNNTGLPHDSKPISNTPTWFGKIFFKWLHSCHLLTRPWNWKEERRMFYLFIFFKKKLSWHFLDPSGKVKSFTNHSL